MLILFDKMQFCDLIYNEYHYKCHLFRLSGAKQHVYAWGRGLLYEVPRLDLSHILLGNTEGMTHRLTIVRVVNS